MTSKRDSVDIEDVRRIIKEELEQLDEQIDHVAIKDVMNRASRLIIAIGAYQKAAATFKKANEAFQKANVTYQNSGQTFKGAVDKFKEDASPAMLNAVTPMPKLSELMKTLEMMVSNPGAYVAAAPKQAKHVTLKPVK